MIGDKYTLWRVEFKADAYKDQMGYERPGGVVLEQIPVTVTETKEVKGMWGASTFTGLKAVSEVGEEFTLNWHSFPDDSMSPTYYWDAREDARGLWQPQDGVQSYNFRFMYPSVTPDGQKAVPVGAMICEKHDRAYYPVGECFGCRLDKIRAEKAEKENQ